MERTGTIEVRIEGRNGTLELSPESFDIRELGELLTRMEDLLFPGERKDRPTIGYRVEEGSVRHLFTTSMQAVIAFNAVLGQIKQQSSIDFLEARTARAIEEIQAEAIERGWMFTLSTALPATERLVIDRTSSFQRTDDVWVDVEMYLYGKVTNAGGKERPNLHLTVTEKGTFLIQTPQEVIANWEKNILYRTFGIRVMGRQNMASGEIDRSSLKYVELIDHHDRFDKAYLSTLRKKAAWLKRIDPDAWLNELRGNDA